MPVTTDDKLPEEGLEEYTSSSAGPAPPERGSRRVVVAAGRRGLALLAGALLFVLGKGTLILGTGAQAARRRWPVVREELRATPGELAAIAAAWAVDAAQDVAGLVRAASEGLAWAGWGTVWATRRTARVTGSSSGRARWAPVSMPPPGS